MRHPLLATAVVAAAALLTGCGLLLDEPSPVSTYEGADGETVTVDWIDYPGEAGQDSAAFLAGPDQDEVVPIATALVERLREVVQREAGVELKATRAKADWFGEESWHASSGNGYGGESMLVTLNCCELQSDSAPPIERWPAVIAAASAVTEEFGLGPLALQHEAPELLTDARWRDEYFGNYCNGPDGRCWLWSATAYADGQWLSFAIQDARFDTTGAGLDDAEKFGSPVVSMSLTYGATTIASGMRDDFERAYAPFEGLEKPAATTSD